MYLDNASTMCVEWKMENILVVPQTQQPEAPSSSFFDDMIERIDESIRDTEEILLELTELLNRIE